MLPIPCVCPSIPTYPELSLPKWVCQSGLFSCPHEILASSLKLRASDMTHPCFTIIILTSLTLFSGCPSTYSARRCGSLFLCRPATNLQVYKSTLATTLWCPTTNLLLVSYKINVTTTQRDILNPESTFQHKPFINQPTGEIQHDDQLVKCHTAEGREK